MSTRVLVWEEAGRHSGFRVNLPASRCGVFSVVLLIYLFLIFNVKECFCFRRTQMSSSTAYGDIQISLKANRVPEALSFLETLASGMVRVFDRKSKPLSAGWEDRSGLQKPADQGVADLVRSVCGLEKSVQTRTPVEVQEDNSLH